MKQQTRATQGKRREGKEHTESRYFTASVLAQNPLSTPKAIQRPIGHTAVLHKRQKAEAHKNTSPPTSRATATPKCLCVEGNDGKINARMYQEGNRFLHFSLNVSVLQS